MSLLHSVQQNIVARRETFIINIHNNNNSNIHIHMMVKGTAVASKEEMSEDVNHHHHQRRQQQQRKQQQSSSCWWQSLEDDIECPITLEPISSLPYPPFALPNNNNNNATANTTTSVTYFDGIALASYIISRGIFENPLTRQELTYETCQQLDDHLIEYCCCDDYLQQQQQGEIIVGNNNTTTVDNNGLNCGGIINKNNNGLLLPRGGGRSITQISVAEAFALRSRIHVEGNTNSSSNNNGTRSSSADDTNINTTTGNNNSNNHHDDDRARVLKNTAISALAGLFVYGNEHRRRQGQGQRRRLTQTLQEQQNDEVTSREDRLILEWGFDLTKQFEETAEYNNGNGWTIIDDDEAIVVESKRGAYQAAQNAFPNLVLPSSGTTSNNIGTGTGTGTAVSTTSEKKNKTNNTTNEKVVDTEFLEHIRQISINENACQIQKQQRLQQARQQLLKEALERRDVKRKEMAEQRKNAIELDLAKKKDVEELEQARAEIEAWRNEQWERLRQISESYEQKGKEKKKAQVGDETMSLNNVPSTAVSTTGEEEVEEQGQQQDLDTTMTAEQKKKAKAAAKRKRAKERKKAQKVEDKMKVEEKQRQQELIAKKEKSSIQCFACGQGIIDCGFDKYNQKFCSPKCSRTATATTVVPPPTSSSSCSSSR